MLDLVREAVTALQEETAIYPQNVPVWMKLMGGSILASGRALLVPIRARTAQHSKEGADSSL
ncbi:MAG: hypothetical protein H6984_04050 [Pseudomonadales bacterium]|nr:hypothetical protein [Halioglobus sp.]MCP5121616.1 hypothetical protein [Pseudomonadales bacterium]MCP5194955.1 hypothetical protein [Pseudomonadales bacterium]